MDKSDIRVYSGQVNQAASLCNATSDARPYLGRHVDELDYDRQGHSHSTSLPEPWSLAAALG
jgi:hypothetical protein